MTKIIGYRTRYAGLEEDEVEALEVHLEIFHGFQTRADIDEVRLQFSTDALGDWVKSQGITVDEAVHRAEHGEGYKYPDYNQPAYDADEEFRYHTNHQHVVKDGVHIVVVEDELDLDDDMIADQP
jgi:hypothetical protein